MLDVFSGEFLILPARPLARHQIPKPDHTWYNSPPMKYHIWTEGCQMNVADSQRVGSSLEHLGYTFTDKAEEADVIVLNTCVVRQSAEDKAYGRLTSLRPLKAAESQPGHQPDGLPGRRARRGKTAPEASLCGCLLAALRPGTACLVPHPGRGPHPWKIAKPPAAS